VKQLTHIFILFALAIFVLTGCQKYEEIEPSVQQVVAPERASDDIVYGEDNVEEVLPTAISPGDGRSGTDRPTDGPDNVNDDDDEEDDDEEQSLNSNN
jgi:hypothetical protein